jgi:hypothetical protein
VATPPLEHLLSLLLAPFTDAGSRTFWPGLALTALVAAWFARSQPWSASWAQLPRPRPAPLDPPRRAAPPRPAAPSWPPRRGHRRAAPSPSRPGSCCVWTTASAPPRRIALSPALLAVLYSLTLFIAWDASRFAAHWLMHKIPLLWAFHQVHHSAERLSPLTFHRVHPVESLIYDLRGALTTGAVAGLFYWLTRGQAEALTLFGVPALGLALERADRQPAPLRAVGALSPRRRGLADEPRPAPASPQRRAGAQSTRTSAPGSRAGIASPGASSSPSRLPVAFGLPAG